MAETPAANIAVILAGHGSARNPDSSRPTREHAETLRRSGRFAEVHAAFWKEEPGLAGILDRVSAHEVFVVPNLACKGYVTGQVIPREMGLDGLLTEREGRRIHLCDPVGTHPRVAEAIAGRVAEVVAANTLPPAETGLLLVGHGTNRNPQSSLQTNVVATRLQQIGLTGEVRTAFLEQEPRIEDWPQTIAAPNVVVMPFMISNGLHGAEDIPALLGIDPAAPALAAMARTGTPAGPFALRGRRLWYCRAVGSEPVVAEIIADIVDQARHSE